MKLTVLIDDERNLVADVVIRNGNTALELYPVIVDRHDIDLLMLDHDLGLGPDGYDVLKYVLSLPPLARPRRVQLVTANPCGRDRMKGLLLDAGYVWTTGTWYRQDT